MTITIIGILFFIFAVWLKTYIKSTLRNIWTEDIFSLRCHHCQTRFIRMGMAHEIHSCYQHCLRCLLQCRHCGKTNEIMSRLGSKLDHETGKPRNAVMHKAIPTRVFYEPPDRPPHQHA